MLTRDTTFARYSKNLCWIISIIWLTLAILSFTSEDSSGPLVGFLWLVGAVAFAISAMALGRGEQGSSTPSEASE